MHNAYVVADAGVAPSPQKFFWLPLHTPLHMIPAAYIWVGVGEGGGDEERVLYSKRRGNFEDQ